MLDASGWIPIRWPSTADESGNAEYWKSAGSLEHLAGTAFNTVVVPGADADFVAAAHQRQIKVVAIDKPFSGCDAVLTAAAGADHIAMTKADQIPDPAASVIALTGLPFPKIQVKNDSGSSVAGPTGTPWVDSNAWAVKLAKARLPKATIWIVPQAAPPVTSPDAYLVALADAYMNGARWPVTLAPGVWNDLASHSDASFALWKRLNTALIVLREPVAVAEPAALGICSDFTGPNGWLSRESLNLCARRQLPYRVLIRKTLAKQSLTGLRAVLWLESDAPAGHELEQLEDFTRRGGLLILPASAAHLTDPYTVASRQEYGYRIVTNGEGKIAAAKKPWTDPYLIASDAHVLLGRKYDFYRVWNASTTLLRFRASERTGNTQLLNFTGRMIGQPMSLYLARQYKSARIRTLDTPGGAALPVLPRDGGVELQIPPFQIYASIDLES